MEKPIDKLQMLKKRFENEKMTGDLSDAARMAKLSPTTVSTGLSRETWKMLTKAERKAMICLRKILDVRKREEKEFEEEII